MSKIPTTDRFSHFFIRKVTKFNDLFEANRSMIPDVEYHCADNEHIKLVGDQVLIQRKGQNRQLYNRVKPNRETYDWLMQKMERISE